MNVHALSFFFREQLIKTNVSLPTKFIKRRLRLCTILVHYNFSKPDIKLGTVSNYGFYDSKLFKQNGWYYSINFNINVSVQEWVYGHFLKKNTQNSLLSKILPSLQEIIRWLRCRSRWFFSRNSTFLISETQSWSSWPNFSIYFDLNFFHLFILKI